MDAHSSQSFHNQGRKDAPICLSIEHAQEVLDSLEWVVDDWQNMDAADKLTHQGYFDVFTSIKKQLKNTRTQPYNKDALLAMDSEELRSIIKDGLIDAETEDFIDKELYIREQRMCVNVYPEPQGEPSY